MKKLKKNKLEQRLLNYINAQPDRDTIKAPYGDFKLARDNWYPKTSRRKTILFAICSPIIAICAWGFLIWLAINE